MLVGLHEAIHGVGIMPSTMNTGTQAVATLFGVINSPCDS